MSGVITVFGVVEDSTIHPNRNALYEVSEVYVGFNNADNIYYQGRMDDVHGTARLRHTLPSSLTVVGVREIIVAMIHGMRTVLVMFLVVGCGSVTSNPETDATNAPDAAILDAATQDSSENADAGCGDSDGDGVCDGADICPGGDDNLDTNGDGIPDVCPLQVLIITSSLGVSVQMELNAFGFTSAIMDGGLLNGAFDYSPYDVVVLSFDSAPADLANLVAQNVSGNVGIVFLRGDSLVDDFDMGASAFWQDSTPFTITDNGHFISSVFAIGTVSLDYTYRSILNTPSVSTRTLGGSPDPALVVHTVFRRVVTPYYGHTAGMPWSNDGAKITWRTFIWASGVGPQ